MSPTLRLTFAFAAFSVLTSSLPAQGPAPFAGQQIPCDDLPTSLAVGDMNGDGFPDLVVSSAGLSASSKVSIRLGNGLGTFGAPQDFPSGRDSVAVADLNGDHRLDVVTADFFAGNVSVQLGTGTGGLGAAAIFPVNGSPNALVVADVNADGIADIVTANDMGLSIPGSVSILLGTGTGGFTALTAIAVGMSHPKSIAVDDVNGDGLRDIVVGSWDVVALGQGRVSILLGTGAGSFGTPTDLPVNAWPTDIALGDVNGDSILDIATADGKWGTVSVLLGTGTGTFAFPLSFGIGVHPDFGSPTKVVIADLNRDGKADLATTNGDPYYTCIGSVSVFLGLGAGSFQAPTLYTVNFNPQSLAVADLNLDGALDLAVANMGWGPHCFGCSGEPGGLSLLLGSGTGTFAAPTSFDVAASTSYLALEDVDSDGKLDLLTSFLDSNDIAVRLGTGSGTFGAPSNVPVGNAGYAKFAIGDVNGDGNPDLATANYGPKTLDLWTGSGSGSFGIWKTLNVAFGPTSVLAVDVDGNGFLDIVTTNKDSSNIAIILGFGAGGFAAPKSLAFQTQEVALGDLDGDGTLDLVGGSGPTTVSVFPGAGGGDFASPIVLDVAGYNPKSMLIGDFDYDGKKDLATANVGSNTVSVLLSLGGGAFTSPKTNEVGKYPRLTAAGDVNGDGLSDFVVANNLANTASILLGTGAGNFAPMVLVGVGTAPRNCELGDLDSDGRLDLVAANGFPGSTLYSFPGPNPHPFVAPNSVTVLLNSLPFPSMTGIATYGTGTWGCTGQLTLTANSPPSNGNAGFALGGANAPKNALGLTLVSDVQDLQGSDPFYAKILMHLSLVNATTLLYFDVKSGSGGEQFASAPIPNVPSLVGLTLFAQSFWVEPPDSRCTPGLAGLTSSRGLAITIQP